jgi:hypothetical protein
MSGTPTNRLKMIAKILEDRDAGLSAVDGAVTQDPPFLRRIYLLAIGPQKERAVKERGK